MKYKSLAIFLLFCSSAFADGSRIVQTDSNGKLASEIQSIFDKAKAKTAESGKRLTEMVIDLVPGHMLGSEKEYGMMSKYWTD